MVRQTSRRRFDLQPFAGKYSDWLGKCLEERKNQSHLLSDKCKVYGDLATKYYDVMVGANGLSREAIGNGGFWTFLTVRQIYPLSNQS